MYILKKLLNHMFENKSLVYPGMLAVFFLAVYLAMKGKKAFHSFNSVVFPLMAICIGVVVIEIILTTEYKGENDILAMMSMSRENGLCTAIIQAIKQGYGCFFVFCISVSTSQSDFRIMFYNVENLFDTVDDPEKNDNEFLPDGTMNWQPWKYWEKLRNISRVITAVGEMYSPAIVGLCEIENDSVIFDLTRRSPLRAQGYEYVVTNSPDERGIDVALLYQRHQFKLLEKNEYEIVFRNKSTRPTRNLLHAAGQVISGDTLDVFVCHWPSRSGGQRESEPARIDAAVLLRNKVDSLFAIREKANIVIMGDFNDHPNDKSLLYNATHIYPEHKIRIFLY